MCVCVLGGRISQHWNHYGSKRHVGASDSGQTRRGIYYAGECLKPEVYPNGLTAWAPTEEISASPPLLS
jgi:hypothetical protein